MGPLSTSSLAVIYAIERPASFGHLVAQQVIHSSGPMDESDFSSIA